jgi:uncharacterized ParB-like nuclease family protein
LKFHQPSNTSHASIKDAAANVQEPIFALAFKIKSQAACVDFSKCHYCLLSKPIP